MIIMDTMPGPRRSSRVLAALMAATLWPAVAVTTAAQPQLPAATGRVNDFANILDARVEAELDQLLKETEDKTTAEVAVVTVPSLQGLSVEEYADRLFRLWGIGQEKVDNGVLVLVAPSERAMRIEVGYGLEGVLPDGLTGEMTRTNFIPHFRNNDYAGGIDEGVKRLAAVVQRNHVLTPDELRALTATGEDRPPMFLMLPFLGAFIGIGWYLFGMGVGAKVSFPMIFGGLFGGLPMIFSLIPFFNAPIWIMGPFALAVFVWGFRNGRKGGGMVEAFKMDARHTKSIAATAGKGRSNAGWSSGSSSSSSWSGSSSSSSSSSSSGSSSSFGGGRSGGGGSSGRW